jgi:carboxypeptidase PM20D1
MNDADLAGHREFLSFLEAEFPLLHQEHSDAHFDGFGRIYRIKGDESGANRAPLLFLAHYDVVPATGDWSHGPFSGDLADGFIWGRGTLDDKSMLMALCEAAETMLRQGRRPDRDVYLAFGGDEEQGGLRGAARMAAHFADQGVRFAAVFDEGSTVVRDMLPMVSAPLALIGTSEKGYLDVTLRAHGEEGHAAMPPRVTALGRLARAIVRLERSPAPTRLADAVADFLKCLGKVSSGVTGFVLSRPRLFWPIIRRVMGRSAGGNALFRTTMAFTMAKGSRSPASLPSAAEAVANLRIIPGETVEIVLDRLRSAIGDEMVEVHALSESEASNPTSTSSPDTELYRHLYKTIREHFPEAVTAPFLVTVTTDSKHYAHLADAVYRFVPLSLDSSDLERIHGTDERISIVEYVRSISFYSAILTQLGSTQT